MAADERSGVWAEASERDRPSKKAARLSLLVRSYRWLRVRLEHPRAVPCIAACAFALSLPAAATGLSIDDYQIERQVTHDVWNGFQFFTPETNPALRAAGLLPWWSDDRLFQNFMRPLSSLTHALDYRLWPRATGLMHVENSLLYAALILLAAALYAQLSLSRGVVALAALFYAANGNHAMTVGWLSGRNTLLATAFGLLSLLLHMRSFAFVSEARSRGLRLGALAALGGSLLSAEIGASTIMCLLAHALTLREGKLSRRVWELAPYLALAIVWYFARGALGYGVEHSGFYRPPAEDPAGFAWMLLTSLPIYLATQLFASVATFCGMYPRGLAIGAVCGLALLYGTRKLFLPALRADARARFLALSAALSALPLSVTPPQDRLVFFIALGISGILAWVVSERLDAPPQVRPHLLASLLFFNHGLYLPAVFVVSLLSIDHANVAGGGARALTRALGDYPGESVVVVNVPSEFAILFQDAMRARAGQTVLEPFSVLYSGLQPATLRRSGERSLDLEVPNGYFATPAERASRDPTRAPFRVGESVQVPHMRATTLAVNALGAPTQVRFDFESPLERLRLLCWSERAPEPCQPPVLSAALALPVPSPL
jgi:hypothetical protein